MYLEIKITAPFQELRYKHLIKIIKIIWIVKIFAECKIVKSETNGTQGCFSRILIRNLFIESENGNVL